MDILFFPSQIVVTLPATLMESELRSERCGALEGQSIRRTGVTHQKLA